MTVGFSPSRMCVCMPPLSSFSLPSLCLPSVHLPSCPSTVLLPLCSACGASVLPAVLDLVSPASHFASSLSLSLAGSPLWV